MHADMSEGWEQTIVGNATLKTLEPRDDESGNPYLPLVYTFPFGHGNSVKDDSVLVKPFRKVLRDGKPIGRINYVFYHDNDQYYALGSFVYTTNRLLFFPGVIQTNVTTGLDGSNPLQRKNPQHIDHLSLESNLRNWHLTLLEKENRGDRYPAQKTLQVNDHMFLWFVMAVQSANKLELMPQTQEIRLRGANYPDLSRRYSIIMKSRGGAIFNTTQVADKPQPPFFINFEFYVSIKQEKQFPPPFPAITASRLSAIKDSRTQAWSRDHRILIAEFKGSIWIRVTKVIGSIKDDAVFVPGYSFLADLDEYKKKEKENVRPLP